ncbi:MAG: TRAP transporter large permease subunit [Proteobacteria bacterium]|nr:TRAP transporter large permease subunit [Pseudomonadota bacterium]
MTQKRLTTLITTVPLVLLLIVIVLCATVGNIHSKLLSVAEDNWTGYSELRAEPVRPTCDQEQAAAQQQDAPKDDPKAEAAGTEASADEDADDFLDDLLGEEEVSEEALAAAKAECQEKIAAYDSIVNRRNSTGLKIYTAIEQAIGKIATDAVKIKAHFLILVFLFCTLAATLNRQHLGLRSPKTRRSDRTSQIAQLVGNLAVLISFIVYYYQDVTSGVEVVSELPILWMFVFGTMALANAWLIYKPLQTPELDDTGNPPKDSWGLAFLGIPLYAYMAWICSIYFMLFELHPSGVAIYLNKMTENADLYTNVALYVFCGMMLKNTSIADKFLALIRPWKLSPELLVFVIVLASAIPTAYSGASGIFVIAAGAIIYEEFKKASMRDSLALAGTAMSGSMGIVLSPCLIVVIIAALNKDVTTTDLYHSGLAVFGVNIAVLGLVLFATARDKFHCASPIVAIPQMFKKIIPIIPYVAIGALVVVFFNLILGTPFNEFTVPYILPFMLLVMLIYDRIMAKREYDKLTDEEKAERTRPSIAKSLIDSADSTANASGGLLALMGMSVCLGGILDRANLAAILPQKFSSYWTAMLVLVIILVGIGMIMDPYGAVILVSATMTQIASANLISPIHFWLVVLCAFELGYLTPPVALNQLLTRQVVGDKGYAYEHDENRPKKFWFRHERIMLPIAVKGIVLLLVAFMPLLLRTLHWINFE